MAIFDAFKKMAIFDAFKKMAIFDAFKKKVKKLTPKKHHFTSSFVHTTDNVPNYLKQVAKEHNVLLDSIDFDVLHVVTLIKFPENEELTPLDSSVRKKIYQKSMQLDPELEIHQSYDINVRPLTQRKDFVLDMDIVIDKGYSKASAVIKASSVLEYSKNFKYQIIYEINKRKIKSGIYVDLFDEMMVDSLIKLVNKIRINEHLDEDFKIELCEWPKPIKSVDDALIIHYKDGLAEPDEHDRIDYRERDFVHAVNEDDVLLEYIQPITGRAGRNFRGEYIALREPNITHVPSFTYDENTVLVTEDDSRSLYYAKCDGYVLHNKERLSVGDELEIASADFKSTGNIHASLDKNIKISMHSEDSSIDQIGQNMVLESDELDISGSVANGATITANVVSVGGQTHKSSTIYAKEAEINIHRGYLEATRVHISRLEHGVVIADFVHVTQMMGGTIRARVIEIDVVGSHATLIASNKITIISELKGSENTFIIEPAVGLNDKDNFAQLKSEHKVLEKALLREEKSFLQKRQQLTQNKEIGERIKKQLLQDKREGRKSSSILIDKYKRYTEFLQEIKALQINMEHKKTRFNAVNDEIIAIQNSTYDAKIVNNSSWRGHNEIYFRLISPEHEERFVPKLAYEGETIVFEVVGADEYEIKVVES
jgi:hypothetical protein